MMCKYHFLLQQDGALPQFVKSISTLLGTVLDLVSKAV